MVKKGDRFKSGETCPESGIYQLYCVCNKKCDVSQEQRTIPLVKDKTFPPCRSCGNCSIEWEFISKA